MSAIEDDEIMPEPTTAEGYKLKHIIEAALLAAEGPLNKTRLAELFPENARPSTAEIGRALEDLGADCADRGVELKEVSSGWRLQVKTDFQPWVANLWTEKPQRYSRAVLETLSLIAYRQPITRGEIESVRGVSLSSNIIRSLQEREWIRIVGHRDVPGKPALFGTTRGFLDYFGLKSLDELPTLAEIKDMDSLEPELAFDRKASNDDDGDGPDEAEGTGEAAAEAGGEAEALAESDDVSAETPATDEAGTASEPARAGGRWDDDDPDDDYYDPDDDDADGSDADEEDDFEDDFEDDDGDEDLDDLQGDEDDDFEDDDFDDDDFDDGDFDQDTDYDSDFDGDDDGDDERDDR